MSNLLSHCKHGFYVTTPIFYVNAAPHIGHLYSAVVADTINRYEKLRNYENKVEFKFSTGTDEHGIKIQQAANKNKISVSEYCDKISKEYKNLFQLAKVNYTDFIRTTNENHKNTVKHFWNVLKTNGHIYSSKYSGWYCISDETFLTESQLKESKNGCKVSIESGHPVEWSEEKNYLFKLSKFQSDIIKWIEKGDRIKPKKFEKILLDYLSEPLNDLSISRPSFRVSWGIPVPDDESQTVYVWLDALINYLTCAGYPSHEKFNKIWPPSVQVIGKDILKFHGIYWPAFLMAADLEPPKRLLVHSHWMVDGEKMSKSKFNVVDPIERSSTYTMEGIRYFLLREGVAHSDGNYSDIKLLRILNSELADTLGNLLSRCCAKSLNPNQIYPKIHIHHFQDIYKLDATKRLIELLNQLPEKCSQHYNEYNFYMVVDQVIKTLHAANNFFETCKPWELKGTTKSLSNNENMISDKNINNNNSYNSSSNTNVNIEMNSKILHINNNNKDMIQIDKEKENINKLETIISITMDTLKICGIILQPIIPGISEKLLNKLDISDVDRYWGSNLKLPQWVINASALTAAEDNNYSDVNFKVNSLMKQLNLDCVKEKKLNTTDSILFRRIMIKEQNKIAKRKTG